MTMITTQTTTATRSERALTYFSGRRVKREHFVKVVEEALDSLPQEFRSRIRNVTVLVEDAPRKQPSPQSRQQRRLLLSLFHGERANQQRHFNRRSSVDEGTGR